VRLGDRANEFPVRGGPRFCAGFADSAAVSGRAWPARLAEAGVTHLAPALMVEGHRPTSPLAADENGCLRVSDRRAAGQDRDADILSSRVLLRPADFDRSQRFYRDVLGLAIYREFGSAANPGVVFFLGPGFLEVSGRPAGPARRGVMIWLQVRDVQAEHGRLAAAGARILRGPTDRDVDRGPGRRPDRSGRGSGRSAAPARPSIKATARARLTKGP